MGRFRELLERHQASDQFILATIVGVWATAVISAVTLATWFFDVPWQLIVLLICVGVIGYCVSALWVMYHPRPLPTVPAPPREDPRTVARRELEADLNQLALQGMALQLRAASISGDFFWDDEDRGWVEQVTDRLNDGGYPVLAETFAMSTDSATAVRQMQTRNDRLRHIIETVHNDAH